MCFEFLQPGNIFWGIIYWGPGGDWKVKTFFPPLYSISLHNDLWPWAVKNLRFLRRKQKINKRSFSTQTKPMNGKFFVIRCGLWKKINNRLSWCSTQFRKLRQHQQQKETKRSNRNRIWINIKGMMKLNLIDLCYPNMIPTWHLIWDDIIVVWSCEGSLPRREQTEDIKQYFFCEKWF